MLRVFKPDEPLHAPRPTMEFDYQSPTYVRLAELVPRIADGWLAQFRGHGLISQWIQLAAGSGPHSHSALLSKTAKGIDLLEMRECVGGRIMPLQYHVERFPGSIDLFSPDLDRWPKFDPAKAVDVMRNLVLRNYGYRGIARIALRRMPLLWRFCKIDTRDVLTPDEARRVKPFCSQAVAIACEQAGVDVVPRMPSCFVQPSDLTHSLFWQYEGSIAACNAP